MLIKDGKLIINEDGFLFGEGPNKVAKDLGEYMSNIANWDEVITTNEFDFCGYIFYGRLLFNETGLYAFMLEPKFKADNEILLKLQSEMDEAIKKNKNNDLEYEIKYEIYPREMGDFCVTLLKKGYEWPSI